MGRTWICYSRSSACNKIILTSDCYTGPAEFVNYGETGYVFKSNDQKSFIENFEKLLSQKNYHKKKIIKNYKNTNLYTKKYFISEIKNFRLIFLLRYGTFPNFFYY